MWKMKETRILAIVKSIDIDERWNEVSAAKCILRCVGGAFVEGEMILQMVEFTLPASLPMAIAAKPGILIDITIRFTE